jgi:hypothetical protein
VHVKIEQPKTWTLVGALVLDKQEVFT